MLKIRQEQIDALVAVRWEAFFIRVCKHVRKAFPEVARQLGDAGLRPVFDSVVRRSHAFELRTERQIVCMMDATILLGDQFEDHPRYQWARDVLTSPYLVADDRAKLVLVTATRISNPDGLGRV